MKKEVLTAIIIGVILGLIITFGVKTAQESLNQPLQNPQPTQSPQSAVIDSLKHNLFLASPQENAIIETEKLLITGSTTPYALVTCLLSDSYASAMADAQGNFTLSLNLKDGASKFTLQSFSNAGDIASINRTVVRTSITKPTPPLTPSPTVEPSVTPVVATASAQTEYDTIKENVKKRIQEVAKSKSSEAGDLGRLVAVIGRLKSRASNTLSIDEAGAIKLASVSAQTQVVRLPGNKSVTLDDISLEDYLTVIGPLGPGSVIDTQKIILQGGLPPAPTYQVAFGQITSYDPKTFLVTLTTSPNQASLTLLLSRKAVISEGLANDTLKTYTRSQPLPPGAYLAAIYLPSEDPDSEPVAYEVIFKTDPPRTAIVELGE